MKMRTFAAALAALAAGSASARSVEYLVKFHEPTAARSFLNNNGGTLTEISKEGNLYKWVSPQDMELTWDANVAYVQQNHTYSILQNPSLEANRAALVAALNNGATVSPNDDPLKDNPEIQNPPTQAAGADPMIANAWGIFKIGADKAWKKTEQGKEIVVAVTDTGVDYNHPDLAPNMWRNKTEIAGNGKDDDNNGYIDDLVGWDFASNDNKPFDLTMSLVQILFQGGNPGHGTHVSGVVGARLNNSVGVAGVAPQVKIMGCRFITEKGQGSTENAIKAIDYAVKNGANIINASWGGEKGEEDDKALEEAIVRAGDAGVIFVAAAGNGRLNQSTGQSAGFDNDTDAKPMIPASLPLKNIVAVSATSDQDALAPFSNWGKKSTRLGAPGVKILSTVPGGKYQDTVIDLGGIKATWDGTSMAAPFVSGSLAVLWSQHKSDKAEDVIKSLLNSTKTVDALKDKVSTGGRLDLSALGN